MKARLVASGPTRGGEVAAGAAPTITTGGRGGGVMA